MRAIGIPATDIEPEVDLRLNAAERPIAPSNIEVTGNRRMVADLLKRDGALVDMPLVSLPQQRIEWLVTANTGRSNGNNENDDPFKPLKCIHVDCPVDDKWGIRKVLSDASEMGSMIS